MSSPKEIKFGEERRKLRAWFYRQSGYASCSGKRLLGDSKGGDNLTVSKTFYVRHRGAFASVGRLCFSLLPDVPFAAPLPNLKLSHPAIAPLLQHPAVAIRIGEAGEAGIVSARRVRPRCEASVPGSNGCLVPNLTNLDPTFEQKAP